MTAQRGFTLIELAIVLVIITILIGGLAMPLSAQIQARRIAETRADMRAIQDALIGYAMRQPAGQPYLPCPDNDGDGKEDLPRGDTDNECVRIRGGLPWRTLGIDEADAWGSRYTYAVSKPFTNSAGFESVDDGDLDVHRSAACSGDGMTGVAVVIVSHGPNARGAQNMSGGTPLAPASVPADERANLPASTAAPCTNRGFVSHLPNEDFDDLVVWLHPNILRDRLCRGGCPPTP
jgi:prepilin-type N-terminal cleavage/methylation domain-containing protein